MNSRWIVVAPIQPGEIISSWMVRTALMQGCDPMTLTLHVWPKWRIWTQDADRFVHEDKFERISALSGIEEARLRLATLFPTVTKIYGKDPPEKAIWTWVIAPGARNTKRHTGIQYCPICLQADSKPYFRLDWRLAWHTVCELHGCGLQDRCPACNAPVEYHRLEAQDKLITVCATCKADLRKSTVRSCLPDALKIQLIIDDVLSKGVGAFQGNGMSAESWIELADYFLSLIRVAMRAEHQTLREFLGLVGVQFSFNAQIQAQTRLETLKNNHRQQLFASLCAVMTASKADFDEALHISKITKQGLGSHKKNLPTWIKTTASLLPSAQRKKSTPSTIRFDEPKPKHQVKRMMARLQRKIEMAQR